MESVIKVQVTKTAQGYQLTIPAIFSIDSDELYTQPQSLDGSLLLTQAVPARSLRPIEELFRELDEAGAADFTIERESDFPPERDFPW